MVLDCLLFTPWVKAGVGGVLTLGCRVEQAQDIQLQTDEIDSRAFVTGQGGATQNEAEAAFENSERAKAVGGGLCGVRRVSFSLVPLGECDQLV